MFGGTVSLMLVFLQKNHCQLVVDSVWMSCRCLSKGQNAVVEIQTQRPVALELYKDYKELGRFMLRYVGSTIAAGVVTEVKGSTYPPFLTKHSRFVLISISWYCIMGMWCLLILLIANVYTVLDQSVRTSWNMILQKKTVWNLWTEVQFPLRATVTQT